MTKEKKGKKSFIRIALIVLLSVIGFIAVSAYPAFLLTRFAFNRYFESWGTKLVALEKRGLLSREFGAGWQDVLTDEQMKNEAQKILDKKQEYGLESKQDIKVVDGIVLADYPSLSIIDKLREVKEYSSTIDIVDRMDRPLSSIRTDHRRARINEFPQVLIKALIAAEDKDYEKNRLGFEFDSFVRAALRSAYEAVFSFHGASPRGTSTITQQVAKLFISRIDEKGMRHVSHSLDRKIRELKLAVALRKMYSPDDILEVYLNHCVTSDFGMIGYKDIAKGLFNKDMNELSDAQCIYLARMVKWGRNIRSKITSQCKIDMPRMGETLGWNAQKQMEVLSQIDTLTFEKPRRFQGGYGPLVDLANEFWLLTLKRNGADSAELEHMNLIDPNSLVRKKGNLVIKLSIDLPLQKQLEQLVNNRGYGPDTTIIDEVRIGSTGELVTTRTRPVDTIRTLEVLNKPQDFFEPGSDFTTSLDKGDTVVVNIRYKRTSSNEYRRSCFYYERRPVVVNGQYFAYTIMDSRTGKLLAYYSKDRLGSRLACLLKNHTPNGSSTAKPILNALNFDLGNFKPYSRWSDSVNVTDDVPWKRTLQYQNGKPFGVEFQNSAVKGVGYPVHNHLNVFEGCQYIFDLLSTSNNILGVETVYRLNHRLFNDNWEILPDAFPYVQFFYRTGSYSRIKDSLHLNSVTGVRIYKELARIVGVDIDSTIAYGKRVPVSDSLYSIALGTLEMNLYQQMHMFNVLYNNDLIQRPADHPSLVLESITLNGDSVNLNDTILRYHPFSDINNIRPTLLGLHKRLVSNRADGLFDFDIPYSADPSDPAFTEGKLNSEALLIKEPLSNIAKSGTTDDVIRPFNTDASTKLRTNYGLWNAVIRVDMSRFSGAQQPDIHDITIACTGECNTKYTGVRDGKTLHKFVTAGLLARAGIRAPGGFFSQYEQYVKRVTPPEENCGSQATPTIDEKSDHSWLDSLGD
jgi:hypothetical protein